MIERKNKTICGHGVPAIVSTVKKNNDNHGRHFYGCPYWQEDDCEFFEWIDKEQYEPRANYVIRDLFSANEGLEKEVAKLKKRAEEINEAEKKIEELKMDIRGLKSENKSMKRQLRIVAARERTYAAIIIISWMFFFMYFAK
ncbi:Endonuclease 8-like 3 [Bienertia sinuspersici]